MATIKNLTKAAIQQASEELRATGAAFVTFQFVDVWYEFAYPFRKAVRICGARKKTGERCRCKALHRGSKCKFHGGLSTGAKTPEGKARAIAAMREGQARWIAGKTQPDAVITRLRIRECELTPTGAFTRLRSHNACAHTREVKAGVITHTHARKAQLSNKVNK